MHPEYDRGKLNFGERPSKSKESFRNFPYLSLVVDKLLIFAYLMREEPVIDEYSEKTLLDTDEKLCLLRARSGKDSWPDESLFNMYLRRLNGNKKYGLPTYIEIIDEIGKDPEVVAIWRRELSYKNDVGGKKSRGFVKGGEVSNSAGDITGESRTRIVSY